MTKATRVVLKSGEFCDTEWAEPWLVTDENGACEVNEDDETEWYSCHVKIGKNVNTRWWNGGHSDVYGDVDGQVLEQGKYWFSFSCFNPFIGYPLVVFNEGGMGAYSFSLRDTRARLSEGESYSFVFMGYKHTITRLNDTDYKEFEVLVAHEKV